MTVHRRRVTLGVDHEYDADAWWSAAREPRTLKQWPASVQPFILSTGDDSVEISGADFARFLAIGSKLPGWCDGPRFAPCPVTMQTVGDDDE